MTNEEASIIIGNIPINGDGCYSIPEYQQAKAMAIEALEQQPCEDAEMKKIDEWKIKEKNAELWIVKGNLQVRYLGTIHNIPLPLVKSQQPCEDAISLQAVKDIICSGVSIDTDADKEYVCELINKLPSVTPKEKTGKWIDEEVGFDGDIAYRCSSCNELFWIEEGTPKDNEYNYCPNCGAKMII